MSRTILITGATGSIGKKLRAHFSTLNSFDLRLVCRNPGNESIVSSCFLRCGEDL